MNCKEIPALSRENIILYIASGDPDKVTEALLSLFLNKVDKDLAIMYCKLAMQSPDFNIRRLGICGMGHIARVYGVPDTGVFDEYIAKFKKCKNPKIQASLRDALDDFKIFIKA